MCTPGVCTLALPPPGEIHSLWFTTERSPLHHREPQKPSLATYRLPSNWISHTYVVQESDASVYANLLLAYARLIIEIDRACDLGLARLALN